MTKLNFKYVVLHSTILFVIARIVEMTLHESGHFLAAILVGAKSISLHHNYVNHMDEGVSFTNILFIKGAGPAVSLLIGLLFHYLCSIDSRRNLLFLFKLYFSAFGYIGFLGYLMVAPFFKGGDTGYICNALGFPIVLTVGLAVLGAVTLFFVMKAFIRYFVEMGSREIIENAETRMPFIHSLIMYPVLLGIVVTTLLNMPASSILSLINPLFSPFAFLWPYGMALRKKYKTNLCNTQFSDLLRPHIVLYVWLVLIIVLNRFLVIGIYSN